jgi:hypothetical protein
MLLGILDGIQQSEILLRPSIILSMLRCLRSFDLPGLIFSFPVDHHCYTQAIIIVVLAINDKLTLPVKHTKHPLHYLF